MSDNNVFYRKKIGFQENHSTKHAIVQLFDQNSWKKSLYTRYFYWSYGVCSNYEVTMEDQFTMLYCRQFTAYENFSTSYINISCDEPKGSILGPLLFSVCVNDLNKSLNALDPIMIADDTNLFHFHQNITNLFGTVNCELEKICEWFISNIFSLNLSKTKIRISYP